MKNVKLFLNQKDIKRYEDWYSDDHKIDRDLQILHIQKGIILPCITFEESNIGKYYKGGVIDKNQVYIPLSGLYRNYNRINQRHLLESTEGYTVPLEKIKYKSGSIIYGGIFQKHWGHFLLESLSRLWFYYKNTELPIAFIYIDNKKPTEQFLEAFELLGIPKDKIIFIDEPTQFDEVIVPEVSFILSHCAHNSFLIPFEKMAENIEPEKFTKIYISRTKWKQNQNLIGEEIFEKIFSENGYKIIYPETLSVREQISYIKGADYIAGFIGSGIHNSVFAKSGTNIIILEKFSLINDTQGVINLIKKLKVTHINTFYTFLPVAWGEGPFLAGISKYLIDYMKKENFISIPPKAGINKNDLIIFIKKWGETYKKSTGYMVNPNIEECIKLVNKIFDDNTVDYIEEDNKFNKLFSLQKIKNILNKNYYLIKYFLRK
ncbi:MAG: glycosyltransferase 61 family protein [Candidatus Paceibacterota bacterium]|nr:glycosyltransferase 61 family protein [Candidatus Paceibacterota bacterium]